MLSITDLIQQENQRAPRKPGKTAPPAVRSRLDAEPTLNRFVYEMGLRALMSRAQVHKLAVALQFPVDSRFLLRVGSELIFILAEVHRETPAAELAATFQAIVPALIFKQKIVRGDNPKELPTAWVYLEIAAPQRRTPVYDYAWECRQSLWSFM